MSCVERTAHWPVGTQAQGSRSARSQNRAQGPAQKERGSVWPLPPLPTLAVQQGLLGPPGGLSGPRARNVRSIPRMGPFGATGALPVLPGRASPASPWEEGREKRRMRQRRVMVTTTQEGGRERARKRQERGNGTDDAYFPWGSANHAAKGAPGEFAGLLAGCCFAAPPTPVRQRRSRGVSKASPLRHG